MKEVLAAIGVALAFIAYIPYIRDTIKGKTTPHVYTWFLWAVISFVIFALQVSDDAGAGAWITLASGVVVFIVFLLGFRQGKKNVTVTDTIMLIASIAALILWLAADQPVLSTILLVLADVIAFVPTVRKSWNKPEQETAISYAIVAVRHGLGVVSLQRFTLVTTLFPATWTAVNLLFFAFLLARRKMVTRNRR